MGKEWLLWGTGGCKSTTKLARSERGGRGGAPQREAAEAAAEPPTGCMCAVLQLFDLHQFQLALHHQPSFKPAAPFLQDHHPCTIFPAATNGIEAPRNSVELELEESRATHSIELESNSSSSSLYNKPRQDLNIPLSIQIKTSRDSVSPRPSTSSKSTRTTNIADDPLLFSESCSSSSPVGPKTPTLVARLMGLDQLPPTPTTGHTPSMHHHHQQQHHSGSSALQFLNQGHSYVSRCSFFDNDVKGGEGGTLSLPETPRISSARRSDVDHGHRLSLQINKENMREEFDDFSSYTAGAAAARKLVAQKRRQLLHTNTNQAGDEGDNGRGGGRRHYAMEIVKQVKERVSRKVGLVDITNTVKTHSHHRIRRSDGVNIGDDDHVVLLKPKKPSKVLTKLSGPESTPSCSPRLLEYSVNKPCHKNQTSCSAVVSPRLVLSSPPTSSASQENNHQVKVYPKPKNHQGGCTKLQEEPRKTVVRKNCKKDGCDKYSHWFRKTAQVSDPILKKKEEPFVRPTIATNKGNNASDKKKCKNTPISNDLFNISVPTLLTVNNKQSQQQQQASSSEGEVRKKCTQVSSCSSPPYKLNFQNNTRDRCSLGSTTTSAATANATCCSGGDLSATVEKEYRPYIQRILKRAGVDKATPLSSAKWYSPSHPLDPSIFHYIELFHPAVTSISPFNSQARELNRRCNRKLVFQLVDEILAGILRPYLRGPNPCGCVWDRQKMMHGSDLIDALCSRINKFPRADCRVLEDIDSLIDADLRESSSWVAAQEIEEEREGMAEEIQREIIKSLAHETMAMAMMIRH